MKLRISVPAALAFVAALALPALAAAAPVPQASNDAQQVATLQVGGGVVMVSNQGAPFASGQSNDPLYSGTRLMVSKNSSATVVYNDGCRQTYDKQGVYTISATCAPGAVAQIKPPTTGTLSTRPIGVMVAAAVVTAAGVAAIASDNRTKCPPVSH